MLLRTGAPAHPHGARRSPKRLLLPASGRRAPLWTVSAWGHFGCAAAELCAVDIVGRLAVRSSAGIGRRAALAEEVLAAVDGGRALQRALAAGGLGTPPSRRPRLPVVAMEPEQAAGGADPEEDGLCVRE